MVKGDGKGLIPWRIPGYMPMIDYPGVWPRWFFQLLCKLEDRLHRKIW